MLRLILFTFAALASSTMGQSCPSNRAVELCCLTVIPYSANPGFETDCHIQVDDPSTIMGATCSGPSGPDCDFEDIGHVCCESATTCEGSIVATNCESFP